MRDEWDRDLLTVTYDPQKITIEQMQGIITKEGFLSQVNETQSTPSQN